VQVSNKNVGGQFHSACSQRSLEAPGHQHCILKDRLDRPNTVVKARELSFKEKIKITSESQSDKRPRGLNADAFLILSLQ